MRVGILGAGQLGRMLALAGYPLGLRFRTLSPDADAPAAPISEHVTAGYDDADVLDAFARDLDVVTYEFENVPVVTARRLEPRVAVRPGPAALEVAQDRLTEKRFFRDLGVGTAPFLPVDDEAMLRDAVDRLGLPAVLKTRRLGYDGKGQFVIRAAADVAPAWAALGGSPLILEGFIEFQRELAIIAVRSTTDETAFYPLVENHHERGVLRLSLAPAPDLRAELQAQAEDIAHRALERLDYVGVLAIELFHCGDELLANEMAPRVHNSGHWSIEGASTSQFENHLRAILGLPLGTTRVDRPAAMMNLLGSVPPLDRLLALPDARVHLYGKAPRPRRKLGHVTLRAADAGQLRQRVDALHRIIAD